MENDPTEIKMITRESGIQIALVISLIGAVATSIWWAATLTTKLDTVINQLENIRAADAIQTQQLMDVRARVEKLEMLGSQNSIETGKRLNELEKRCDLHFTKETK